jgi:hypothetical protein
VTRVIRCDTACDAMRRSIFPIGLPECSNSERIRAWWPQMRESLARCNAFQEDLRSYQLLFPPAKLPKD